LFKGSDGTILWDKSTAFDGDFSAGWHYRIFEQLRPDQIASITPIACKSSTLFPVQQSRHGKKGEKLLRFQVTSVTAKKFCKEAFFYNFKLVLFFYHHLLQWVH